MTRDVQFIDQPHEGVELNEDSKKSDQIGGSPSTARKNEVTAGRNQLNAMIVDSNLIVRNTAAAMFQKIGYHVTTANEGGDAFFQFQKLPRDLLLTDLEMAVINGYQLARRIKMAFPSTKVAIMTGLNLIEVAPLLKDGSIDGWLFKPFGFRELKAVLMNMGLPYVKDAKASERIR